MPDRPAAFVVLDLASLVVFDSGGLERCLDVVLRACDLPDDARGEPSRRPSSEPRLRHVYGALERVLVAHVTCDPFVGSIPSVSFFLARLRARGVLAFGAAAFSPALSRAIARRFGWDELGLRIVTTQGDGAPLWSAALASAEDRGLAALDGVFVSDDNWELASAAKRGCSRAIALGPGGESLTSLGVRAAPSLRDALRHLGGWLLTPAGGAVGPAR